MRFLPHQPVDELALLSKTGERFDIWRRADTRCVLTALARWAPQCQLRVCIQLQASVAERLLQSERLLFQEEALKALHHLLTQDLHWYQEETRRLSSFRHRVLQTQRR